MASGFSSAGGATPNLGGGPDGAVDANMATGGSGGGASGIGGGSASGSPSGSTGTAGCTSRSGDGCAARTSAADAEMARARAAAPSWMRTLRGISGARVPSFLRRAMRSSAAPARPMSAITSPREDMETSASPSSP